MNNSKSYLSSIVQNARRSSVVAGRKVAVAVVGPHTFIAACKSANVEAKGRTPGRALRAMRRAMAHA